MFLDYDDDYQLSAEELKERNFPTSSEATMKKAIPVLHNFFKDIPVNAKNEITEIMAMKGAMRIERIVSTGQTSPEGFFYDQDADEFVILLKGRAVMSFSNGSKITLNEGDFMNIPKNLKHRVDFTEDPTIWLAVFY